MDNQTHQTLQLAKLYTDLHGLREKINNEILPAMAHLGTDDAELAQ